MLTDWWVCSQVVTPPPPIDLAKDLGCHVPDCRRSDRYRPGHHEVDDWQRCQEPPACVPPRYIPSRSGRGT